MVSSVPYFSFPFTIGVRSRRQRQLQVKQSRKRKHDATEDAPARTDGHEEDDELLSSDDDDNNQEDEEGSPSDGPADDATPSMPAEDVVPGPTPFPHRPLGRIPGRQWMWGHRTAEDVAQGLAELSPPLCVPSAGRGSRATVGTPSTISLRRRHLSVLTTVMHRALLDGDRDRAGRAWALLLRSTVDGKPPDLRGEGRWGIGAEVLLRQGRPQTLHVSDPTRESSDEDEDGRGEGEDERTTGRGSRAGMTTDGVHRAREYYERLILQWPHHPQSARWTNALQLYPAMFGLWIYATQQQQAIEAEQSGALEHDDDDEASSRSDVSGEEGRGTERREAEAIAARMDELMLSPHYADSAELWHLRGMLALWMADLYRPARGVAEDAPDAMRSDEYDDEGHQRRDGARRNDELARARAAFRRVRQAGGTVWDGIPASLRVDDDPHDDDRA